jgi:putative oxidoreductase
MCRRRFFEEHPLNIALWSVQAILASLFGMAGFVKTFQPDKARGAFDWAQKAPAWFILFIGVTEILGAIGILAPYATGILPFLTAWAAIGFTVIMVLAFGVHLQAKDTRGSILNIVFFLLSVAVAYGRW